VTWVCGCATQFIGTAICVGDIQVTLGTGEAFDCLRKVYPIDQNIAAGFAGDVEIGFAQLGALSRLVAAMRGDRPEPVAVERVIEQFSRAAREEFKRAPIRNRHGQSEIMLTGASFSEDHIYSSRPIAARFRSPDFGCTEIARGDWGSIGSGSAVESYRSALQGLTEEKEGESAPVTMEANNPGGYAQIMFISLMSDLRDLEPVPGVSSHFHAIIATAHGFQPFNSDVTKFPPDGPPVEINMPEVAESWPELQALIGKKTGRVPAVARA
jgi:hypothetical protein